MRHFLLILILLMGTYLLWGQIENTIITVTSDYDLLDVSQDGSSFWVSVSTSELQVSWTIRLYLFRFHFDPDIIEYQGFSTAGTLADYGSSGSLFIAPGIVELSWFDLTPLAGEGDLIRLHFEALDNGLSYLNVSNFVYDAAGSQLSITNIVSDEILITGIEHPQVESPIFNPEPGLYIFSQLVAITTNTENALIYYTIDGTEPDEGSLFYTEMIEISSNTLLQAKAYKQGWIPSEIQSGNYFIGQTTPIATITAESVETEIGEIFEVAIMTTELFAEWNIYSFNFTLSFDPLIISYLQLVTTGTIINGGQVFGYIPPDQPNSLSVGWFNSVPLTGAGDLIKIRFNSLNGGTSDLILSDFYYNDVIIDDLINGVVNISSDTLPAPTNLTIIKDELQVSLSWDGVQGAISYRIYGSVDPSAEVWQLLSEVPVPEWSTPIEQPVFFYRVTAHSGQ